MEYDCLDCGFKKREKEPWQCPRCWGYNLRVEKPWKPGVCAGDLLTARSRLVWASPEISVSFIMGVFKDLGLE